MKTLKEYILKLELELESEFRQYAIALGETNRLMLGHSKSIFPHDIDFKTERIGSEIDLKATIVVAIYFDHLPREIKEYCVKEVWKEKPEFDFPVGFFYRETESKPLMVTIELESFAVTTLV